VPGRMTDSDGSAEEGHIQSVVRAADIIRLLTQEGVSSISVAEASKALGLQRTTTHRYMATLIAVSMLQREPGSTGRYILGPLAHEIFSAIMRGKRILAIAPSLMQKLADQTACTVTLGLWDGSAALVSHVMYPSQSELTVRVPSGYRVDPTGAQTIMFMAFLSDPQQLQAVLDNVPPEDLPQVQRQISRARADHFVEDVVHDVVAVAAPVFDSRGICATIALLSTTSRLGSGPGTEQAGLLFDAVRQLSAEIGHVDPAWAMGPAGVVATGDGEPRVKSGRPG
jgi:DNA-binding IclR family transcriptional regulator